MTDRDPAPQDAAPKATKAKSRAPKINRTLHRYGSIITAAPLLIIIVTGIILQLKKDMAWVQPPTARGSSSELAVDWDQILAAAASAPEAEIATWTDIDRLDVRPSKGVIKVRAMNRWEVQIDTSTGEVLQTSYRRSDLIEALHDGSWFGSFSKLGIFLPTAVILLGLWCTGIYLWLLPHLRKRRRARPRS